MWPFLCRLFGRGDRVERKIDRLLAMQETTMSKLDDLVKDLDAETNAIAAKMDKMKADLIAAIENNQTPSQATIDALSAISGRLKALGADPAQPIPPAPVEPAPAAPAP